MPAVPSSSEMEDKRPKCVYSVSRLDKQKIEQCRNYWEHYREVFVEGFNRALKTYAARLQQLDKRLQLQVPKIITADQYEDYKTTIAQELASATQRDGEYFAQYSAYINEYTRNVNQVVADFRKALVTQ